MASLHLRAAGTYYISFRFQGRPFQRSLKTQDKTEASQKKSKIERTLHLLDEGVLNVGASATTNELWRFLLTGGQPAPKTNLQSSLTLARAKPDTLQVLAVRPKTSRP